MKPIALHLTVVAVALAFIGCASPPEPQFANVPGEFNMQKIQDDIWSISYTGVAGMSQSRAEAIAGQRASALCIAEKFRYFIVLQSDTSWQARPPQPGMPPESIAAHEHTVPAVTGQVRFFKDRPDVPTQAVYDAAQTQQNLQAFN